MTPRGVRRLPDRPDGRLADVRLGQRGGAGPAIQQFGRRARAHRQPRGGAGRQPQSPKIGHDLCESLCVHTE